MRIEDALREEAQSAATRAQNRLNALEAELAEAERKKLEVEAKRNQARLAPKRLGEYRFKIGKEYQCPRCWIEHEHRSPLRPVPSRNRDDIMACTVCPAEFLIPTG